jgi:hypothetical protein
MEPQLATLTRERFSDPARPGTVQSQRRKPPSVLMT